MPGNKYNGNTSVPTSRIERLLRERELRKNSKASYSNEVTGNDAFEFEPRLKEGDNLVEQYLEGASAAREGWEKPDGGLFTQRLLVVANRLPVSAVRRGEESWSLEVSAGGLVSALLGVKEVEAKWIGWAGVNVPDEPGQRALTKALAEKKANQMFADVVNEHYEEGDVVWCHDYHLMFLPKCLKDHNSNMKVGWFLHTPFPSSEIHRTLPSRSELLRAVLAADLVGFHTYDYARHFVSACTRILGLEGTPEGVEDQGRLTRVAAFPIGIDSDRFIRALENPQVQEHIKELKERFSGRKVMLGVDRLDMIKGIPQKILAFEKFLEENQYWRDKVVLLQIAVPTRTDVPEYQKLTSQDRSLDFQALCALYAVTDIAIVTSLRDGMNLVSYEFVACQDAKRGVLILIEAQQRIRQVPPALPVEEAIECYLQSSNRLVILGFSATLTEPVDTPDRRGGDQIREMDLKLHPELKESLIKLCNDPQTTVVVLSGSDRTVLDDNFGEYNMWLAAENGMFLRSTRGTWMTTMPEHSNMEWVDNVEFGRLQARDMLQHLWTGPISNASVDVVQGSRSVEVRAAGVTKGITIVRILGEIVHSKSISSPIDYVLCIGHFLGKDEDIYTFFEPELPSNGMGIPRPKLNDGAKPKPPGDRKAGKSGWKSCQKRPPQSPDNKRTSNNNRNYGSENGGKRSSTTPDKVSWNVLDLKADNYFSCAVGRTRTNARYLLPTSDDVVSFLKDLAQAS
ncbi:Glycosyl transferase, family 20 [Cynara cardunculus var. scolymus]|uniref:Glycosyl transferase, family 20 n=1 Tax=Cynara cardunculus var. scolymus TaxID=59895 RepID=A0A103Y423_CYNCS|nr:Glycosyl transferase, family 20 [Cynara cardunculus var. scolymus]